MNYNEFIDKLFSLQDLKFKEFNSKIVMDNNVIGVRTPELKQLAKIIARSDYAKFFKEKKPFWLFFLVLYFFVLSSITYASLISLFSNKRNPIKILLIFAFFALKQ